MNLSTPLTKSNAFPVIGTSKAMQNVWHQVEQVAPTNATVLITGETGVGKEVVAQTIHERSSRKNRLFKAVNCGVFYQDLLQSELFGHEKGAFTGATNQRRGVFELADGGTLFLDEIGEMSPEVQVKFLRVLETQEFTRLGGEKNVKVNVRIIAATNVNLEKSVKDDKFRQDLYYRLNLFHIQIPPLRYRREDIPLFVDAFIPELSTKHNKSVTGITPEALDYLKEADWPGNIRQLKNAVESAIILTATEELELADFSTNPEPEFPQYPVKILDEPGTSIQVVNQNTGTVATENVAIYKTILGLILSAVRLLEPSAAYNAELPTLIPDDDTSWLQITDTEDTTIVLRKTLEVLSTIATALENRTQDDVISITTPMDHQQGSKNVGGEYLTVIDDEDTIGKVGMTMTQIEREAIEKTLAETGGNKTEAAKILDIGVRTLYRKLDEYEQDTDEERDTLSQG